jgi:hypothetical protein
MCDGWEPRPTGTYASVPQWLRPRHDCPVEVMLGSATDGQFMLSESKRGDDGELWSVMASIAVEGLRASEKINVHFATCMDELIEYFDELAAHWQGWNVVKTYESLEKNLRLTARVDDIGHISLAVELRSDHIDHH